MRATRSALVLVLLACALAAPAVAANLGTGPDAATCLTKPRRVVHLGSPVAGVLTEIYVDRGEAVQHGQLLAKLDTTVEEAQLALDRFRSVQTQPEDAARVDMEMNERTLARHKKLIGNMFTRIDEVDEATTKIEQDKIAISKAQADVALAKLEAQRSEAQLNLKMLRAPVDGVVSDVKMAPGEFTYEQTPVLTIAEIDPLRVEVVMGAEAYTAVKIGMQAELTLESPVGRVSQGHVTGIDPVIDAASDTFRFWIEMPNPDHAVPAGTRCSVRLPSATANE